MNIKKTLAHAKGVTLIEMLVVIAILAVMSAIAFPAYTAQVLKTNRMDAKRILMQIQTAYERYYVENNNVYPTVGITGTYSALSLGTPPSSSNYTFSASASGTSYTLSATTAGAEVADTDCTNFYLDNLGNRTATSSTCW
jgi:type IV pilus assembly protein PilE